MPAEQVVAVVNGMPWTGFRHVTIHGSIKKGVTSACLTIATTAGPSATHSIFALWSPIQIFSGRDLVCDGYIDGRRPQMNSSERHIVIRIRTKAQDAADCSAQHKTGEIKNKTPLEIAKELDVVKVGFSSMAKMTKIPVFRITKGESIFRAVERACREQGLTLVGRASGIEIWNAKTQPPRHKGGLIEGVNMEVAWSDFDASNRHSEVRVHGQKSQGHGKAILQIEGLSLDATVPRFRPKIIAHDGEVDKMRADGKAKALRDRKAGEGLKAGVELPSWRDEGGKLWTPGYRIWTESPFLDLKQDMLLEEYVFDEDEREGTKATLSLVDPRAYGGSAGKGNKSGGGWNMAGGASGGAVQEAGSAGGGSNVG